MYSPNLSRRQPSRLAFGQLLNEVNARHEPSVAPCWVALYATGRRKMRPAHPRRPVENHVAAFGDELRTQVPAEQFLAHTGLEREIVLLDRAKERELRATRGALAAGLAGVRPSKLLTS